MTKSRLNKIELTVLANAQLMNKITADRLKAVKEKINTAELASTVVGEDAKGNVHNPYKLDGVVEVQVINSVRETVDTTMLIQMLGSVVDSDTLNHMVAECTRVSNVHTVNIKPDKRYAVEFERKLNAGLELLDELENVKAEVKAKVLKMIGKQAN